MIRIRDIMTTDVIALAPEMSLREALNVLVSSHVSGAPVLNGPKVVGVVSTTDLLEFIAEPPNPEASDGGREEWVEGEAAPAAFFMDLWHQGEEDVTERFREGVGTEADLLASHSVSEAMTRATKSLPPETFVDAAARYMRDQGIHRILVQDGDVLLGVVSTTDIAHAVADHRLEQRSFVFNRDEDFDDRRAWQAPPAPDDRDG
jgi:CBS domain-containing membrane protein